MNKPSTNYRVKIISALNWNFGICTFLALLIVLFSYVWTENKLAVPIHTFIWKHLTNVYYILSILIILSVLSKVLSFLLSFFIKKEEVTDTKQLTEKLSKDFTTAAEQTNNALTSAEKRISIISEKQNKLETVILHNCGKIQQELSYAEQRVSLFVIKNQQNLYQNIRRKSDFPQEISKADVSRKLIQVIDLLEKAKTDIQSE